MSTNAIFVVAQRDFSAQVEIKIGIRRNEKIRFARTNSSSGNPPLRLISTRRICSRELKLFVAEHAQFWNYITNIKLHMLSDEKIRFARTNSSSGNPALRKTFSDKSFYLEILIIFNNMVKGNTLQVSL